MALTAIKAKFHPSDSMANTLSQWIGSARVIYNAKCDEDTYLRAYARKYLPVGTRPEIDKGYSQYKTELTPWLKDTPSQILRNSATIWFHTYQRFFKRLGGRPKRKNRIKGNYVWLTRELFRIRWEGSMAYVELGTVKNPIGQISAKFGSKRIPKQNPASIWIRKSSHGWSIAFSFEDGVSVEQSSNQDHLAYLQSLDTDTLSKMITPVDRGVARPVQTHAEQPYELTDKAKAKIQYRDKLIRRYQRQLARQTKGSNRRKITLYRIAKLKNIDANVRQDFWHQTTRRIADESKVVVIEDLKLKQMTQKPKAKISQITGKWEKNGAKAKAGLNRVMLSTGLGMFEQFLSYKLAMANKPLFKIDPKHTSQECANCGHIHPSNRTTQSGFQCVSCGHTDNADHNAALVIRKRAVNLILNSGTELAGKHNNVLRLRTTHNSRKPIKGKPDVAMNDLSKMRVA